MSCRIFIDRFDYGCTKKGERKKAEHENGLSTLAYALRSVYGAELAQQTIIRGTHGKPYFDNRNDIQFSISHSGDFAAAAVCEFPVGVDIQVYCPIKEAMINKLCDETELRYINSCADRSRAFLHLWTLKESYIKATGDGMSFPMNEINFDICGFSGKLTGRISNREGLYYLKDCGLFALAACVL